jgi:hypothetical protein
LMDMHILAYHHVKSTRARNSHLHEYQQL